MSSLRPSHSLPLSVAIWYCFDSFDPFNFFNFDIFNPSRSSPENSATYGPAKFGMGLAPIASAAKAMLKISILDTPTHRRLVVEGKLIAPWAAELRSVWRTATADLHGRELVIDVKCLTGITEDGESVLLEMMKEGANFRSSGVFTKHVLKRLARKIHRKVQEAQ